MKQEERDRRQVIRDEITELEFQREEEKYVLSNFPTFIAIITLFVVVINHYLEESSCNYLSPQVSVLFWACVGIILIFAGFLCPAINEDNKKRRKIQDLYDSLNNKQFNSKDKNKELEKNKRTLAIGIMGGLVSGGALLAYQILLSTSGAIIAIIGAIIVAFIIWKMAIKKIKRNSP